MQDRIDPLIAERAPWLFQDRPGTRLARAALHQMLGYQATLRLARQIEHCSSAEIFATLGALIARDAQGTGLGHIPRHGPALIVANHPTGIADGIILHHLIAPLRPDLFFFANHDILRVLPQMSDMIAPVEWRVEKRTHQKTRATLEYTQQALAEGRLGVIFPSGRLAKRRGLKLHERPWMASAAMIARRFDVPVIPLNIRARNSALFYLFDLIHPTLRDITLFHEVLNKHRQPFRLTVGAPIPASALPHRSEAGIDMLRAATLALGGTHAPAVSLIQTSRLGAGRQVAING